MASDAKRTCVAAPDEWLRLYNAWSASWVTRNMDEINDWVQQQQDAWETMPFEHFELLSRNTKWHWRDFGPREWVAECRRLNAADSVEYRSALHNTESALRARLQAEWDGMQMHPRQAQLLRNYAAWQPNMTCRTAVRALLRARAAGAPAPAMVSEFADPLMRELAIALCGAIIEPSTGPGADDHAASTP